MKPFFRFFKILTLLLLLDSFVGGGSRPTVIPSTSVETAPESSIPIPLDNNQSSSYPMTLLVQAPNSSTILPPESSVPMSLDSNQPSSNPTKSVQVPVPRLTTFRSMWSSASTWFNPPLTNAESVFPPQISMLSRPYTPRRTSFPIPTTTFPVDLQNSITSNPLMWSEPFTRASTFRPNITSATSIPQHAQITFGNKYQDLILTDYDRTIRETDMRKLLADACVIDQNRITDVYLKPNSSGYLVVRFSIQQGYPISTETAVQNLKTQLNTTYFRLGDQTLVAPVAIFWTDNGPCPVKACQNSGQCDVTAEGELACTCKSGFSGNLCQSQPNNDLFALLVLLVIPIAIALIVGFTVGKRKQQKAQLKKAFDLRDVRTIGPRSMLSLPQEPGMRNEMYDTRSFAMAFTDTSFSKPTVSATEDGSSVIF